MADDRSHAVRLHLSNEQLLISSQNAEEGEARETIGTDFTGEDTEIGFNAQYLQDFLNVVGSEKVAFEFKDGNSQAQLRPVSEEKHDYRYVIMPMRLWNLSSRWPKKRLRTPKERRHEGRSFLWVNGHVFDPLSRVERGNLTSRPVLQFVDVS